LLIEEKVTEISIKLLQPVELFLLTYSKNGRFDLHFDIERDQFKNMLQALKIFCVNQLDSGTKCRFPCSIENILIGRKDDSNLCDLKIDKTLAIFNELDNEQQEAVEKSLNQLFTTITGPPGTGKTKVLVGIMEQVYQSLEKDEKILICAPSNNATDNLFKKGCLIAEKANDHESVRLYGNFVNQENKISKYDAHRIMNDILSTNTKYRTLVAQTKEIESKMLNTNLFQNELNQLQSRKKLVARLIMKEEENCLKTIVKQARIISTTCTLSSHTVLRRLNFKIVFIDEAFCCMLPTILEPLSKTIKHAILAFDSKQLGKIHKF